MKKILFVALLFLPIITMAQLDEFSLLGIPQGTTAEITGIAAGNMGSLAYSTNEGRLYLFNSGGWVSIPTGTSGSAVVSTDPGNVITTGTDGGVYYNISENGPVKAMGRVSATGTTATSYMLNATVTHPSTGVYDIILNPSQPDADYIIMLTTSQVGNKFTVASYENQTANGFRVLIRTDNNANLNDGEFMFNITDF